MKSFSFRLEKALRWREAQLDIEKARAAEALGRVSEIQAAAERQRSEAAEAAGQLIGHPNGIPMAMYAGFLERDRSRTRRFKEQLTAAKTSLAAEMKRVVEANRKLHLLEKMKSAAGAEWRKELDRDLAQFADEAFLGRLQSKKRHLP